jgi:hypothetical protein
MAPGCADTQTGWVLFGGAPDEASAATSGRSPRRLNCRGQRGRRDCGEKAKLAFMALRV